MKIGELVVFKHGKDCNIYSITNINGSSISIISSNRMVNKTTDINSIRIASDIEIMIGRK